MNAVTKKTATLWLDNKNREETYALDASRDAAYRFISGELFTEARGTCNIF